jgi:hypothetical protein
MAFFRPARRGTEAAHVMLKLKRSVVRKIQLVSIERLIMSAQKRLDRYLEDLERTSKAHARALRVAAEKAIAENDAAVLASRK